MLKVRSFQFSKNLTSQFIFNILLKKLTSSLKIFVQNKLKNRAKKLNLSQKMAYAISEEFWLSVDMYDEEPRFQESGQ